MLSSEKDGPCNATGVLALEEERFGLAILESEDLAITADVELALQINASDFYAQISINLKSESSCHKLFLATIDVADLNRSYLSRVDLLAGEGVVVGTHIVRLREYPPTVLVVELMATLRRWVESCRYPQLLTIPKFIVAAPR